LVLHGNAPFVDGYRIFIRFWQGSRVAKTVTDLLLFEGLRAPAKFCNPLAMFQLSFRVRSASVLRHSLGLSVLAAAGVCFLSSAESEDQGVGVKWVAPAAQAQKSNPVKADAASIAAGQKIYMQRCAKCHGEGGKGDGPDAVELKLHPARFSDPSVHSQPDGALYWKISVGKKGMPDFAKRLSPNDRWNVVNFLRKLGGS
jgi:mono/diheme cytochrome c family protein